MRQTAGARQRGTETGEGTPDRRISAVFVGVTCVKTFRNMSVSQSGLERCPVIHAVAHQSTTLTERTPVQPSLGTGEDREQLVSPYAKLAPIVVSEPTVQPGNALVAR